MSILRNLFSYKNLLKQFVYRDIISRYKGSYFGAIWTIIQPLVMLAIYSFVFSVIFKVKWGNSAGVSNVEFALTIFAGLIIFQIFSEPMYRSTAILSANSNFVKRVVFPLEILPTSAVLSSLILNLFSVIVLIGALIWFGYPIGWNLLLMPVVLLPLVLLTQGLSYIVTTLGVYFRDLGQAMGIIMNVLFYLSPVFYPITAVPEKFQSYMHINPLTSLIEAFRAVTINNTQPDWGQLSIIYIVSFGVFLLGAYIFKISKETFSDVI